MVGGQPAAVITATGPAGSVSMVAARDPENGGQAGGTRLIYEPAMTGEQSVRESEVIHREAAAGADGMDAFERQQLYLYECISGDACMAEHYADVLTSMTIVAAGDEAAASGKTVAL